MALRLRAETELPTHSGPGGFDYGDIHVASGLVYIAHTANGTLEVIDGERLEHQATIGGCEEAGGVLYAPSLDLIFAAARGAGKIPVIAGAGPAAPSKWAHPYRRRRSHF